jgi:hypothetical protein
MQSKPLPEGSGCSSGFTGGGIYGILKKGIIDKYDKIHWD